MVDNATTVNDEREIYVQYCIGYNKFVNWVASYSTLVNTRMLLVCCSLTADIRTSVLINALTELAAS